MGRQGSLCTPLHAGVQGAIDRLLGTFGHVTLLIGSTDLGIFFLSRDQKHTNLVRVSTQSRDQVQPSDLSQRIALVAAPWQAAPKRHQPGKKNVVTFVNALVANQFLENSNPL